MAKAQKKQPAKKQPIDPIEQQNNEMIRDVDESLRQDQLKELWEKYGSMAVTAAVSVILITAIISGWGSWKTHTSKNQTDILINALASNDLDASTASLKGAHKTIATLELASQKMKAGKTEEASELYKQIANDKKIPQTYRDLGSLLYATTTSDETASDTLVELSQDTKSPWAAQAGLELALVEGGKGNYTEALDILNTVNDSETTPTATRQKAKSLITLYTLKGEK